jgi:hypothetical protein
MLAPLRGLSQNNTNQKPISQMVLNFIAPTWWEVRNPDVKTAIWLFWARIRQKSLYDWTSFGILN